MTKGAYTSTTACTIGKGAFTTGDGNSAVCPYRPPTGTVADPRSRWLPAGPRSARRRAAGAGRRASSVRTVNAGPAVEVALGERASGWRPLLIAPSRQRSHAWLRRWRAACNRRLRGGCAESPVRDWSCLPRPPRPGTTLPSGTSIGRDAGEHGPAPPRRRRPPGGDHRCIARPDRHAGPAAFPRVRRLSLVSATASSMPDPACRLSPGSGQ